MQVGCSTFWYNDVLIVYLLDIETNEILYIHEEYFTHEVHIDLFRNQVIQDAMKQYNRKLECERILSTTIH